MPKSKSSPIDTSQNSVYYAARVLQRLSLLVAAGTTIALWATNISVAINFALFSGIKNFSFKNSQDVAQMLNNIDSALAAKAVTASIIALLFSLAMLAFLRVRNNEKRLVIDGVVVAVFCFMATALCQSMINNFAGEVLR